MINDFVEPGSGEPEEIIPSASPNVVPVVEADKIIVHHEPRISANKLAEYVTADPVRQMTIIRDSKFAKKVVIIPYKKVRNFIGHAFAHDGLDIDKLCGRAKEIRTETAISDWQSRDNTHSASALEKIAQIAPELSWKNARIFHAKLGDLEFAKVKVTVHPEVVFCFEHRKITKAGGVILNTAKSDDKSLERGNGSHCVGDYLSSLLFQALLTKGSRIGTPLNTKCYAVDVWRGKIYTAPASYRTLNKHMEAACVAIAALWPQIQQKS